MVTMIESKASEFERVEDMVPPSGFVDAYINRHMENGMLDFDLFDVIVEEEENIMLTGPTGSGKSLATRAYAAYRQTPYAVIESHGAMDPGTVLGRTVGEAGETRFVPGDPMLVVEHGGFLMIEEFNMMHPRIAAAFNMLLSDVRRITIPEAGRTIRAAGCDCHDVPLTIGSAFNPKYAGGSKLNFATADRFEYLKWGFVREVEEQLIKSVSLLDVADGMRELADIHTPVSTRALVRFERHTRRLGVEMAIRMFANKFEDDGEEAAVLRSFEGAKARIASEIEAAA
jgi:MoxR-like ATPase